MGSMRTTLPDFDAPGSKVQAPARLAHVVLRTNNFQAMLDFYTTFLGGQVAHRAGDGLAFISYDEEHHRIALIGPVGAPESGIAPKNPWSCGLEHIAFTFPTLPDLLLAYRQRRARHIHPVWCINHGITTSIYYKDPDGNMLETQVDNFPHAHDANAYMSGPLFAENPIGVDFDPEDLIARLKRGEPEDRLKQRPDLGPRDVPNLAELQPRRYDEVVA